MKKKIVISLVVLIVALVTLGVLISLQCRSFQSNARFSEGTTSAYYPINGGMITVAPDIRLCFDSASPVTAISKADLEKFKALGVKVDSISTIFLGFSSAHRLRIVNRIYRISLPAPAFDVDPTRSPCTAFSPDYSSEGRIIDVDFVPSIDNTSRLGMDFIKKFVVEYSWATGMIVLHDAVPQGFQKFSDFKEEISIADKILSPGGQYFLEMEVDGRPNEFLVDTSISRITINVPEDDGVRARVSMSDPFLIRNKYVSAMREPDQLVMIGSSAKYQDIHRSNAVDRGERYFCNPLNMFVNDIVLDFSDKKLYLRRGSQMLHPPGFGLPVE